jgi:hypothetical protein
MSHRRNDTTDCVIHKAASALHGHASLCYSELPVEGPGRSRVTVQIVVRKRFAH